MAIPDNRKLRVTGEKRIRWMRAISILLTAVIFGWMVIKPWTVSYSQASGPNLVVTPLTWDVVGLDSVNPTLGPTKYMIGAQVCNLGDAAASGINALLKWADSNTAFITSSSNVNIFIGNLGINACRDVYYTISINPTATQGTVRGYTVEVTANGGIVSTLSTPHQIFVERDNFNSSGGLNIVGFTGVGSPVVGQQYKVVMTGNASMEMEQFENLINYPPDKLALNSVSSSYQNPTGTTIGGPYADACGWNSDPTITTTYRTCVGPAKIGTGTISGQVVTTYTFSVLATGSFTLTGTLYGFVPGHYYYNGDFGLLPFPVTAVNPTATPTGTSTGTATNTPTPTVTGTPPTATPTLTITPTGSGTPPTPTSTGTIVPSPGVTKGVSPSSASNGGLFTFTIKVVNTGNAPATNVTLTDSFSAYTYLDIYNLTTTAGTTNVSGRVATVNIGTLMPNQSVTVTLTIYVNSNSTSTTYPCNSASISYGSSLSRVSNTVCYTVYGTATLPGTGENPRQISDDFATSIMSTILFGLVLLAVLFLTVKVILYVKPNLSGKARLYTIAAVLFVLATIFGVVLVGGIDWSGNSGAEISLEMTTETAELPLTSTPTPTVNPLSILPAYLFATPGTPGPIETLPSYPIPTPSLQPTQAPGEKEPDTSAIKRIVIPALNLDTVVAYVPFDGHTWMIQGLRQEVAWLGNTSWPGLGGNTALAGHVTVQDVGNGPFRFLFNLKQGDEVLLYTEKNVYSYRVATSREVELTDLSVTEKTENSQVTLITCVEWSETLNTYTSRYVVTGELADVTPIVRPAGN